jgi:hypothetical protein
LFWSGIALGTGVVLGATAVTLGVHTERKHDRWQSERDALEGPLEASDEAVSRLRESYEESLSIQRLEYAATATGVLGIACLGASALLWFTAADVPVVPAASVTAQPAGATLSYHGRF